MNPLPGADAVRGPPAPARSFSEPLDIAGTERARIVGGRQKLIRVFPPVIRESSPAPTQQRR